MKNPRTRLILILGLVLVLAVIAALPSLLTTPTPTVTPSPTRSISSPITSASPTPGSPRETPALVAPATWDVSKLPTITPPAPGEPTLPPEALAMHAAPTATPGSPPSPPTGTPTTTPFPTPAAINPSGRDDVPMVEVPAGEFIMGTTYEENDRRQLEWDNDNANGPLLDFHNETPQLVVRLGAFSIDKLEVTNARYRRCVDAGICSPAGQVSNVPLDYSTSSAYDEFPVMGADWYGADAYCQWVGKRLPTEAEWEKAACGTDGRMYPWGNTWDASRATEQESPKPVGSFLSGASPYGALDMLGNAPEWTTDWYAPYPQQIDGFRASNSGAQNVYKVSRGEWSYIYSPVVTYRTFRYPLQTSGFRCAKGQTPPPSLNSVVVSTTAIRPLPTATAVDLSRMVYIPAGEFIMGTNVITGPFPEGRTNELPQHVVYLDAFYIDTFPVTYAEYVKFLNVLRSNNWACLGKTCANVNDYDSGGYISDNKIDHYNGQYVVKEGFDNYAADRISWAGAYAYCKWLGKRLPTEAEWEKAGRGTDGRNYPWGNDDSPTQSRTSQSSIGNETFNISPYGVHDLLGHTLEWVNDWYLEDYYEFSPLVNPRGPDNGEYKVARGCVGSSISCPITRRRASLFDQEGFRCAYPDQ